MGGEGRGDRARLAGALAEVVQALAAAAVDAEGALPHEVLPADAAAALRPAEGAGGGRGDVLEVPPVLREEPGRLAQEEVRGGEQGAAAADAAAGCGGRGGRRVSEARAAASSPRGGNTAITAARRARLSFGSATTPEIFSKMRLSCFSPSTSAAASTLLGGARGPERKRADRGRNGARVGASL